MIPLRTHYRRCWLILALAIAIGCGKRSTKTSSPSNERIASTPAPKVVESFAGDLNQDVRLVTPKTLSDKKYVGPLADAYKRIDPSNDGWSSEAFGEAANAQLKLLAKQMVSASSDQSASNPKLVTESFNAPSFVGGDELPEAYRDANIVVHRLPSRSESDSSADDSATRGETRLQELTAELAGQFSGPPHIKFKLYRIEANESNVETMVYFHADGSTEINDKEVGRKEITANWHMIWSSGSTKPQLDVIEIEELEIVTSANQGKYLFADATESVLGQNQSYRKQLLHSTDHWRSRLCRDYGLDVVANHGLAIGDVNGDMLEDIYICQQGGLPNRLFVQNTDGTLKDVSQGSGADWLDYSASALLVDLDNDGDKDLAVGHEQNIVLMSNDGTGKFTIGHVLDSRAQTFSLAAADYDNDGDLDIYCCGYNNLTAMMRTGAMGEPIPYHDAQNGGPNMLLRNAGKWNFVDVTDQVGLGENNNRFSFAASWEDYDNDGDVDLYVSNDYGRNNLYRNDNGRFRDVAGELNVEDMSAGMSISWADMNRDGWMDFYVSNMFSAAGNRITYQRQFKTTTSNETKKQYQRHARGNSLFQSDGKGGFRDISESAGITMGRWAWGSKFCDINNDGWQDIVVNNGFISTQDTGDL